MARIAALSASMNALDAYPASNCIDGLTTTTCAARDYQLHNWLSVRLPVGVSVGHVSTVPTNEHGLLDVLWPYEIYVGAHAGDTTSQKSTRCLTPFDRPAQTTTTIVSACLGANGEYVTLKQTGANPSFLRLNELTIFESTVPSLPPLPPSPPSPPSPISPPPLPPSSPPLAPSYLSVLSEADNSPNLNHHKCVAFLSDRRSRFHQLWGEQGWHVRPLTGSRPACWHNNGLQFFHDAWAGGVCRSRNWYTGNEGSLGQRGGGPTRDWVQPHFRDWDNAVAVLGFDEDIDRYCFAHGGHDGQHARRCVEANANILSLYGNEIPYNICRNLEWQVCAARGWLPGQHTDAIRFAIAPNDLRPYDNSWKPIGWCGGYTPEGCHDRGYASSDIFYLESCVYSMMCSNREELWNLEADEDFHCQLDPAGFDQMRDWLLGGGGGDWPPAAPASAPSAAASGCDCGWTNGGANCGAGDGSVCWNACCGR